MSEKALFAATLVVGLLAALYLRAPAPAEAEPVASRPAPGNDAGTGLLVDLGNTTCPVMGGEPDGEHFLEWNHLRVGFCCAGCDARFLVDPEARLDRAAPGWRDAAEAVRAFLDAKPAHRARRLEQIRSRWTVLREGED